MKKSLLIIIILASFTSCNKTVTKPIYVADKWENPEW